MAPIDLRREKLRARLGPPGATTSRASHAPLLGRRRPALGQVHMDAVELSRFQFASTSIFHFFFVSLAVGLAS